MRSLLVCLILVLVGGSVFAQDSIPAADASKYIGQQVTVYGKIYGGKFLAQAKNSPTFLNMGAVYPDQPLTIVIWGDTRKQFSFKPEERYNNKTVYVTGRIDTYKEKPQIVITAVSQIKER